MSIFNKPPPGSTGNVVTPPITHPVIPPPTAAAPAAQPAPVITPGMTPTTGQLTLAQVEQSVPANLKNMITQQFVDQINNIAADPILAESIRNNFVSFTNVMKDGRFKIEDYLNAVTYVSYKLMGYSNQDAYQRTFPARYQALVNRGALPKDISAYVAAYNKNKLVNLVYEQTAVPTWVLNQHLYQEAIGVQAELMRTAVSEKVRTEAANSLLTHLKKPDKDFQISLDVKENSGITELKNALRDIAQAQSSAVSSGVPIKQIADSPIIELEANRDRDPN